MPKKQLEIVGKKFNRLTVLKQSRIKGLSNGRNVKIFLCKCSCGKKKEIYGEFLRSGHTKSCGCLQKEVLIKRSIKHGMSPRGKYYRFYWIWASMIQRCTNRNNVDSWKKYGARGTKVCGRWMIFKNFMNDMLVPYNEHVKKFGEKNTQIDRIKNSGNYLKSNCRWVTLKEQARNRRNNHLVIYCGKRYTISELSEKYNINYGTLLSRINRSKMSIKKAVSLPIRKCHSRRQNFNHK